MSVSGSEWIPLRKAIELAEFKFNTLYPAKFPTLLPNYCYGRVKVLERRGDYCYAINGYIPHGLDGPVKEIKGQPLAGDVLVLRSSLEENRDGKEIRSEVQELKACPFCGVQDIFYDNMCWRIVCSECGARSPRSPGFKQAVERWNKRVGEGE